MEFTKIGDRVWRCRYGLVIYYYVRRAAYFLPWDDVIPISAADQRHILNFTSQVNGMFTKDGVAL